MPARTSPAPCVLLLLRMLLLLLLLRMMLVMMLLLLMVLVIIMLGRTVMVMLTVGRGVIWIWGCFSGEGGGVAMVGSGRAEGGLGGGVAVVGGGGVRVIRVSTGDCWELTDPANLYNSRPK